MSCPAEHRTAEAQRADRDWLSKSSDGSQLIASLSPLPALNFGCFEAGILIGSPVRGLRPSEAARLRTLKVPKPTSRTSCPFFNDFVMESNTASTALAASALVSSVTAATASTSSFLFTSGPPSCSMRHRLLDRICQIACANGKARRVYIGGLAGVNQAKHESSAFLVIVARSAQRRGPSQVTAL